MVKSCFYVRRTTYFLSNLLGICVIDIPVLSWGCDPAMEVYGGVFRTALLDILCMPYM